MFLKIVVSIFVQISCEPFLVKITGKINVKHGF